MILVHPLQILGSPQDTGGTVACPSCSAQASVREDGSVLCKAELSFFAPDPANPADKELSELRQKFDQGNGIDVAARWLLPISVFRGVPFDCRNLPRRAQTEKAAA